ncbi:titin homolog [Palaemon carinicauda]|uniref:titin homolog n=1 Tax=Palaemon carinicauda TaxID=392227 RepID=UPI0035B61B34
MADPSPLYRKCSKGCQTRHRKGSVDPHMICVKCRGKLFAYGDWCEECSSLAESQWVAYELYTQKLEKDRIRKERIRRSSSRSVNLSRSDVINPFTSPVVVDQEPKEPTTRDMLSAIQALGVRVESLAADKKQMMSEINFLKSGRTSDRSSVKSPTNVFSVVEDAPAQSCRSPSLRPLSSSRKGRSYVEGRKGIRGFISRVDIPSSEVSALSPSSDEESRDDRWRKESRPIKRKVQSVEQPHVSSPQQPDCSHWETPERFRSLDECSSAKRSKVVSEGDRVMDSDAELISGSCVTIHAPPLPSDWDSSPERNKDVESDEEDEFAIEKAVQLSAQNDPKWNMLLNMKQQLSSMMQSYRPVVGSEAGLQSSVVDPLSHRRPVVSGTDVISHRQFPKSTVQRKVGVDMFRQRAVSQQISKEYSADIQVKRVNVRQVAERAAKRQDGSRRDAQAEPKRQCGEPQELIDDGQQRQAGSKRQRDDLQQSSHKWTERQRVSVVRQDSSERQRIYRVNVARQEAAERRQPDSRIIK